MYLKKKKNLFSLLNQGSFKFLSHSWHFIASSYMCTAVLTVRRNLTGRWLFFSDLSLRSVWIYPCMLSVLHSYKLMKNLGVHCWLNVFIGKCDGLGNGGGYPASKTGHFFLPSSSIAFYSITCFSCLLPLILPTFSCICFLSCFINHTILTSQLRSVPSQ